MIIKGCFQNSVINLLYPPFMRIRYFKKTGKQIITIFAIWNIIISTKYIYYGSDYQTGDQQKRASSIYSI